MTERIYIEPKVKLISGDASDLGYYTWLKSRKEIILDMENKVNFMKDLIFEKDWLSKVPEEFYVGSELVNKYDYKDRINKMNLQYNNFEYFVFEINGSCLFRDLLYNINTLAQWATSNRFLFSILDDSAVYDSKNYNVSAEYKDIPEWEIQFDKYMEAIKANRKTDINRLEMPYSISSYFWIGINKKTLLNLLFMLKEEMPFFYNIYGVQFMKEVGINESMLPKNLDASISQYFRNSDATDEKVQRIGRYVLVESRMALILYSQFIRQSSTTISGLFDILKHSNPEEFSHKVFKGNTIFHISYLANEDKVNQTIKNRLCAFAMSSGTEPDSWSYFINNFLPKDITIDEFKNLLPCKFGKNGELVECKFHDDIKFRNEGKEVANCPCPIFLNSIEVAKRKKDEDKNLIGDMYYKVVESLTK